MKLKLMRATIYGFGSWVDDTIDFSGESYICIYGENESGKSTLQQFILFMLFGLPPKMRAFYRPKSSGKMGGRLVLMDDNGEEFTIERLDHIRNGAAVCYTPDGGEYNEAWLTDRLKGMTSTTYQSIFSFSGLDLSGIKQMKEEDLGEVLLGIGLTGAKNLHAIEKRLDNQVGDLFKRYGKKPVINQQLATLDDLFASLKKYENEEAAYRDKKAEVQAITDDMMKLQSVLQQAKEEKLRLEKQQQTHPILKEYHYYTQQLSTYPVQLTFPENGLTRLNVLKEKLLPLKSEWSVVTDNLEKYKEKQITLKKQLYDEALYEQAQALLQEKQTYLENKREMNELNKTIQQLDIQMDHELNQLDVGLTKKDLATISFPFYIEQTWNELKSDAGQLNIESDQLQQEELSLQKQRSALQEQKREKEVSVLSTEQVNELTEKMNNYHNRQYMQSLQEASAHNQSKWLALKKQQEKRVTAVFIGSVIAAIVFAIIANVVDHSILYLGSGISLLLGAGQYIWGKQSFKMTEQELYVQANEVSTHTTREEKEKAESLLAKDNQNRRELDMINEQLKALQMKLIQWEERQTTWETKKNRITEKMKTEQENYPFLKQININFWPEFYHTIKHLLHLYNQRMKCLEQYQQQKHFQQVFANRIQGFFEQIIRESDNESVESQLDLMENILTDSRDITSMIKQYDNWIQENNEQQRILQQKMRVYEQEISGLFNTAEVDNEEAFLKKAKQLEEKGKVADKRSEMIHQLSMFFSEQTYKQLLAKELLDERLLHDETEQIKMKMNELEKELDTKRQQLAEANADLAMMESSETYSETMHRFQMEKEELKKSAEEWAILKTAKEMLAGAKRNYREKYVHKVIRHTLAYFGALTDHHYTKIYPPSNNILFQVEASDGIRYNVNELSQGTIDQLYVALRLAISEVMSEEHCLPFMIDDAFVYFDAIRTKRVMDILAEHAREQQIIIFTCKREVLEAAKEARMIHLEKARSHA